MNKTTEYTLKALLAMAVVAGCVYGGRVEYNDEVLSGMSLVKYQYIHDRIGGGSRSDVVKEYLDRREFYDSLSY